eukprot:3109244-Prymnesium_polylepis.1
MNSQPKRLTLASLLHAPTWPEGCENAGERTPLGPLSHVPSVPRYVFTSSSGPEHHHTNTHTNTVHVLMLVRASPSVSP